MRMFNINYGTLYHVLDEKKVKRRGRYLNDFYYCRSCRIWVEKTVAKHRGWHFYCPQCGRRLRTKPRYPSHRGVKKQKRKRGKPALETEAHLIELRQEVGGKI
jgi:predicted RNA-binding Zn-ribbon protein involved in translation (DUF1610 family)